MTSPASRGRRCARHGLAAGPDGWCALCRSESLPPPKRWSTRLSVVVLGAVLLTCAAALAYRGLALFKSAVEREPVAKLALAPPASSATGQRLEPRAHESAPEAAPTTGESFPLDQPIPPPAAPTLDPAAPAPTASALAADRLERSKPPPTEAELQAALSATPIVMYATTWCGVCRRAREFLRQNGLNYQEIDADKMPGGWDKVEQLSGRAAVPVIVVDGVVTQGLKPTRVMQAVAASMERRLGVKGIQFRAPAKG